MCIRANKLWACGCAVLDDDGATEWVLERCESACGAIQATRYTFGPIMCAAHDSSFYRVLGLEQTRPVAGPLTVGIEFEFLVAQQVGADIPEDNASPARWMMTEANKTKRPSELVKGRIVEVLESTVPIYSAHRMGRSLEYLKAKMKKFNITSLTEFPEYAMWQITTDASLRAIPSEDPSGYAFTPNKMELVSRVLHDDDLDEIELVYGKLRGAMRLHVNSSCGFHVHVGISHLSILEIKKFVTVIVFFEPFLFHLVAPHRAENSYSCPLTTSSNAFADEESEAYEYQGDEDTEPLGRNDENPEMDSWLPDARLLSSKLGSLRHVWNSTTLDHIRNEISVKQDPSSELAGEARASCIRLRGDHSSTDIEGNQRSSDITMEFRHREASGDPVVDREWVVLCASLVGCAQLPKTEFGELINIVENTSVEPDGKTKPDDFAILLGAVGLEASVGFWQGVYQRYQDDLLAPPAPALLSPLRADVEEA